MDSDVKFGSVLSGVEILALPLTSHVDSDLWHDFSKGLLLHLKLYPKALQTVPGTCRHSVHLP